MSLVSWANKNGPGDKEKRIGRGQEVSTPHVAESPAQGGRAGQTAILAIWLNL